MRACLAVIVVQQKVNEYICWYHALHFENKWKKFQRAPVNKTILSNSRSAVKINRKLEQYKHKNWASEGLLFFLQF